MKNRMKKTFVSLLSIILLANSMDLSGLTVSAAESISKSAVIMSFAELEDAVVGQTVPMDSEESAIRFPNTLTATVKKTVTTKTVSGSDATVSGNGSAGEGAGQEILVTETTDVTEEIEVLRWKIDAANSDADSFVSDESAYGYVYTYVPELKLTDSEGTALTMADGVTVPEIYVRVGDPINPLADTYFTVNYFLEVDPENTTYPAGSLYKKQNLLDETETKYFVLYDKQIVSSYPAGTLVSSAREYEGDSVRKMVVLQPTRTVIPSTVRGYDFMELLDGYDLVEGGQQDGGFRVVTADNTLTFNFHWGLPTYSEVHMVETEVSGSTSGLVKYNGKYYKTLVNNQVKVTDENVNTTVTIPDLSGTEGFEDYIALASQPSSYPTSGTVDSRGELCIYRFYDKKTTSSYTERYYVEDENATENYIRLNVNGELITYRLHHEKRVENAYVGDLVTITDLSGTPAFSGYTLVDRGYLSTAKVQNNDATYVYQFYDKNPIATYSVAYYVEVYENQKDGSNITVNVNGIDKYYNRIPDSAYNMQCYAPEGTIITVADSASDVPGVYAGGVAVSDTFKAYTSTLRKYSYDTTVTYGKHTGTVAADGSLQIVLFYDWLDTLPTIANYSEIYYVELKDQNATDGYDYTDEAGIKYECYSFKKTGTVGEEVEIGDIDWSDKDDYYVVPATPTYPSKAMVSADNPTIVYRFYRVKPLYVVYYYIEADDGTFTVGDKSYERDDATIFMGKVSPGSTIGYLKKGDGGVAITVAGSELAESVKRYDGYAFSEDATLQNGKGTQTIYREINKPVELFFDKVLQTTTYREEYYIECENQSTISYDLDIGGVKYDLYEYNEVSIKNNEGAKITDKSKEEPYSRYTLLSPSDDFPWEVDDVADDKSTVLYQIYDRDPQCEFVYYTQAEDGTIVGPDNRKYTVADRWKTRVPVGIEVTYTQHEKGTAIMLEGAKIPGFERIFDGYEFNPEVTQSAGEYCYEVVKGGTNRLSLYHDKYVPTATYTEEYYVEYEDQSVTTYDLEVNGIKYRLTESYPYTIEKDLGAEINDKSGVVPYSEYELQASTTECPSKVENIADDNSTVLYQLYRLQPKYTVRYYKESKAGENGAIPVGEKYYVLADTITGEARTNSTVEYWERQDGMVGVLVNASENADSFKSYANYVFSEEATLQNNKGNLTMVRDTDRIIELFFDKEPTTSYQVVYYGEIKDQSSTDFDKKIDGIKYKLLDSYIVEGVALNTRIEAADRSAEYAQMGYDLMPEIAENPSWSTHAKKDGTSVLYQIYRFRPGYTVHYYTEVDKESDNTVEICGKYYVMQEDHTLVKFVPEGTVVAYAEKNDREAGVAEDGGGVADSVRSYEGYLFNSAVTRVNDKVLGTVTRDNAVVIELFFDRIRADYTEKYWVEAPDATTDYIEVKVAGAVRKFILAKTNVIEDAWANAKVSVMDRSTEFAGYVSVYEAVDGYSAVAYGIETDGSTEVHQFFLLEEEPVTEPPVADVPKPNPWQKSEKDENGERKSPVTGDKDNRGLAILALCASYMALLLKRKAKNG